MSDPLTDIACTRCQDHGWTLDDQRVTPCACPAGQELDLPRWAVKGDPACIVAHVRDPERPRRAAKGMLCQGCYSHLEWVIAEMPARYDELADALAPGSGGGGGKVSGTADAKLPIVPVVAAHRDEIAHTLASWSALLVEEHNETEYAAWEARYAVWQDTYTRDLATLEQEPAYVPICSPRDTAPTTTATLLVSHLSWAARQPWITDLLGEMQALRSRAVVLLNPSGRRRIEVGPCGEDDCPGTLMLTISTDEGQSMTCDDCRRTVEPRYWRRERKRIDGVDANPWVPLDVAAMQYDVSVRTLQRWIAKGKLKARGEPTRVRLSAVEGVMRGLSRCA